MPANPFRRPDRPAGSGPAAAGAAAAEATAGGAAWDRFGKEPAVDSLEACLLYLCRTHGCPASSAALREGLSGQRERMAMRDFIPAAERAGLEVAVVRQSLARLATGALPAVAILNDGRAVVLVARPEPDRFVVYDPVAGAAEAVVPLAVLNTRHSGVVIAARPRRRATAAGPTRHWFWRPLAQNWWTYLQVLMAAAMVNILGLATSIFIMVVYDRVLPNEAIESLFALTVGVGIALLFDFILKTLRGAFIDRAGQRADITMGRAVFNHLLDLQMRARRGSSGALANVLREFETLRDFFTSATLVTLVDLPFILLFIFVIHLIAGPLAIVPALAVPLVLVIGILVQPFLARLSEAAHKEGQTKHGVLIETISGLETIKATGAAPTMRRRWEDSIGQQSGLGIRSRAIAQFALNSTASAQQAAQIGVVFYGVFLIQDGVISMGGMIAAVILTGCTLAPLAQLAQTMTRFNQARSAYRAISALMGAPTDREAGRHYLSRPRFEGGFECRRVRFRYPDQHGDALSDISFTVKPGEKVAILGRIGSGKSTLVRLLLGLYEPDDGAVLVDGIDIRQIDPADLRRNIGSVLQDVWLFSGTIRQNIALGTSRPDDAALIRAATVAGVHDFVARHPLGYDLAIEERGEGLSGGQRQSIALARALVGTPPLLVFDEPTSAMDVHTERLVIARLKEETKDRTLVVITHRTSLLDLVDRVIVIEQGRVASDGPKSMLRVPPQAAGQAPASGGNPPTQTQDKPAGGLRPTIVTTS